MHTAIQVSPPLPSRTQKEGGSQFPGYNSCRPAEYGTSCCLLLITSSLQLQKLRSIGNHLHRYPLERDLKGMLDSRHHRRELNQSDKRTVKLLIRESYVLVRAVFVGLFQLSDYFARDLTVSQAR